MHVALLFKGGEQLYEEALDHVGRKDFSVARKKFSDAESKGYSKDGLVRVYIAIIDVGSARGNPSKYRALIDALNGIGTGSFMFGLTEVEVEPLKTECDLIAKEIEASSIDDREYQRKGSEMISVAGAFMGAIGDRPLKIDEIFKGNTQSTGNREALILQANAYAVMGRGCVSTDPKMAAEYMQMAYNFRKQLGDDGSEEMRLAENYARSATCWICGRPANGEGIHFQAMRSTVEPVFSNMSNNDIVKPVSDDCRNIYVCMPCYTAISNRSDDISRYYYDQAMKEMRLMEARLQHEIAAVRLMSRR